ncbi:hypothetical protein [Xenorhabdus ehlersii]|uniref:Uncharacterized protein n=1 Tax=Xenorhabdus ehlersii TaxID=290111 RepID=A0A2D0IMG5_9GAMM|nr:hypothetical protein [Xenorhabdus ehlersii]PHM23005.1 hypothetical protein Xehl_03239 [Xenorhabdus ehlersii]RKE92672.1 hypothetical protein BDE27_0329 [Xenorhabdus ehlersii]
MNKSQIFSAAPQTATTNAITYFLIETKYEGPYDNAPAYVDLDTITISRAAPIDSIMGVLGYCGTVGEMSVYLHGRYPTIEAAREAIYSMWDAVRDRDPQGYRYQSIDKNVVEVYKPGRYTPLSSEASCDWAMAEIFRDIEADTTDERIAEIVAESEARSNRNGYTHHKSLRYIIEDYRNEKYAALRSLNQSGK